MDGYQFIASIIQTLFQTLAAFAWPVAFFGAVWLFRKELTRLLPFLRFKYKDWEMSFLFVISLGLSAIAALQLWPDRYSVPDAVKGYCML